LGTLVATREKSGKPVYRTDRKGSGDLKIFYLVLAWGGEERLEACELAAREGGTRLRDQGAVPSIAAAATKKKEPINVSARLTRGELSEKV